jgi:hypothetical protein
MTDNPNLTPETRPDMLHSLRAEWAECGDDDILKAGWADRNALLLFDALAADQKRPEARGDLRRALLRAEQTLRNLASGDLEAEAKTIASNEAANIRAVLAAGEEKP